MCVENAEPMEKYKAVMKRYKKAAEFMDGTASDQEKDIWLPEFLKIINEAGLLARQLGLTDEDEKDWCK